MKEATILLKNSLNVNISCEHLTIANIVALVHLEKELDLETILNSVPRAIYEPEQFPGLMLRLAAPTNATVLLFSSGKAIITGLRSEQSAQVACDELFSLVKEISNT
jgi:transcription initiation factor TFIID TATA-box-binding protein